MEACGRRGWGRVVGAGDGRGSCPAPGNHDRCGAACRGNDGRLERGVAPGRRGGPSGGPSGRPRGTPVSGRSAPAEQRAAQPSQWREERDAAHSRSPRTSVLCGLTCGQLAHQRGRLGRLDLRNGGAAQHREMAVETRTGRAAPARDRRDPRPAAHCYLFHVTPHPYESTRPGQSNPIAPSGHSCIAVTGFTFPTRALTTPSRSISKSHRFQGELDNWLSGGLLRAPIRLDGHSE